MLKKILIAIGLVILLLLGSVGVALVATAPVPPMTGSQSADWLRPGDLAVASTSQVFVDPSRPTQSNGLFPGAPERTFEVQMWYPTELLGSHPLVVYSHGFMSNNRGGTYLAEALAGHGYVVIAANYPLTHGGAPGGAYVGDVVNQAADVSFLIDSVLALTGADKPFSGEIDVSRIGVAGLSLGGLTSTLVGFHPRWRDPRISAVVSIAGPASMFLTEFFAHAPRPFMMVAGNIDAIVPYVGNADDITARVADSTLVTIDAGSHVGFADVAEPYMRWMENPDEMGCQAITAAISSSSERRANPFEGLGGVADGISFDGDGPALCASLPLPPSLHPGRQHMITQVAVLSFFESHFAQDSDRRSAAAAVLAAHLAQDFPEVSVRR